MCAPVPAGPVPCISVVKNTSKRADRTVATATKGREPSRSTPRKAKNDAAASSAVAGRLGARRGGGLGSGHAEQSNRGPFAADPRILGADVESGA